MRVLEVVSDPDDIARVLHGARAPPPDVPTLRAKSCCSPADRALLASRPAPWCSPEVEISPGKFGMCYHTNYLCGDLRTARKAEKSASQAPPARMPREPRT
jgi:hypothetical protein